MIDRDINEHYVDLAIAIVEMCVFDFVTGRNCEKTFRDNLKANRILELLDIDIDIFVEKAKKRKEFIQMLGGVRNFYEYTKKWNDDNTRHWGED